MYSVIFIYDEGAVEVYELEDYDTKIINFLMSTTKVLKNSNIIITEGKFHGSYGNKIVFINKLKDIINSFSILDDDLYDEDIRENYLDVCNYIKNKYIKEKVS